MVKIGIDWFVKIKCPKPSMVIKSREGHIKACSDCPYAIWEQPEMVASFMASMCGVRAGSAGMAAELDTIGEKLLGIKEFTQTESGPALKLRVLKQIKKHAERNGWKLRRFTKKETFEQLHLLMEFCKRAEAKGLNIRVWA